MKLAEWFNIPNPDGSRRRKDAFASAIGVTPQMISAYCDNRMWPNKARMAAIVQETGGEVTPNDFLGVVEVAPQ